MEEREDPEIKPDEAFEVDPKQTTCFNCDEREKCPYAFDPYNTDGECLASK